MSKRSLIVIVVLDVIISLYSSFAFLYGFYDPFYPTSCIAPDEILKPKATVAQHSRLYASYYPFSLIFNTIMHIVLNIDCFELGLIPFLPFLHLLLFYVLISVYFRSSKQRIILLLLYSCLLVAYLYAVFPPYYVTIGNTGYMIFLYMLLFFNRKRGGNSILAKDFIVLLLLFLLGTFSYYTSGFASVTTIMVMTIFNLIQKILKRKRMFEDRKFFHVRSKAFMVYLTLILSLIYIYFDYMFLQNLKHVVDLEFPYVIISILAHRKIEPKDAYLVYNPPTPPLFFLIVTRISIYFVLILSIGFTIATLMKLFRNKASPEWFIVTSAFLSSFLISLYYSFLMGVIYIRYYLLFQLFLIPLIIFPTGENVHKANVVLFFTYVTLFLLALSNIYNTIYSLLNSNTLSAYTNYLLEEYATICNFISNRELAYKIMADLKTAFSIPVRCNDKDLYVVVFEHKFFSYFNTSHNIIVNVTKGIYFYPVKYMQTPIFMPSWKHYKPFVISYMLFNGVIYNSAFTTLWIKLQ